MRSTYFILFFVLLAFATTSCKKTTTGEETPPEPTPTDKLTASEWKGDSLKTTANPPIPTQANQKQAIAAARLTFNKDKTFTGKIFEATSPQNGTWELQSNDTKIKLVGGFQTELKNTIDAIIDGLSGALPAGTTINSVTIPEIYDLLALTDKKLVMKAAINVNVSIQFGPIVVPQTVPINVEVSFKR